MVMFIEKRPAKGSSPEITERASDCSPMIVWHERTETDRMVSIMIALSLPCFDMETEFDRDAR
jgi:hypothetical protein